MSEKPTWAHSKSSEAAIETSSGPIHRHWEHLQNKLWAHTQLMVPLVNGPMWAFPTLQANLHVGFYVLSGTFWQHGLNHGSTSVALPIYLFIFGELIDAYENRHISHVDRIKMVLRVYFFKSIWKSFLRSAGYPEIRYFISAAADDIIDILIHGLIGLIYVYRDHLSQRFPLLPWMHGSEPTEHVFGLLRSLVMDFTMVDVVRLIPKLNVRLMAACRAKNVKVNFRRTAAGYSHTYFDTDEIPLGILSEFPSDQDIAHAASSAFDEANALWDILGYYHSTSQPEGNSSTPATFLSQPHTHEEEDTEDVDQEANSTAYVESDRRLLQDALNSSTSLSGLDSHSQACLDECTYAAACLSIADQEEM